HRIAACAERTLLEDVLDRLRKLRGSRARALQRQVGCDQVLRLAAALVVDRRAGGRGEGLNAPAAHVGVRARRAAETTPDRGPDGTTGERNIPEAVADR